MLTTRRAAVASTAALVMGLGALPAAAQGQEGTGTGAAPTVAAATGHTVAAAAEPSAVAQAEVRRSIPWHKNVSKCARHGKKYAYKVKLNNRCKRSFTYHLEIARGPDRCVTVRRGKSKTVDWRWPGRLAKVRNGSVGGRC